MTDAIIASRLDGLRIGILHHDRTRIVRRGYLIDLMAGLWQERGAEVVDIIGIDTRVPVDLLLLHVDLSVVPEAYRRFAQDHPRVINRSAIDIRKRSYLDDLVGREDVSSGPVIVKSDLNHGGLPERLLGAPRSGLGRLAAGIGRQLRRRLGLVGDIRSKSDYEIFPDRGSVPARRFEDGSVVQPFRPERLDGAFVLREYYFLGEIEVLSMEIGSDPILTTGVRSNSGWLPRRRRCGRFEID